MTTTGAFLIRFRLMKPNLMPAGPTHDLDPSAPVQETVTTGSLSDVGAMLRQISAACGPGQQVQLLSLQPIVLLHDPVPPEVMTILQMLVAGLPDEATGRARQYLGVPDESEPTPE